MIDEHRNFVIDGEGGTMEVEVNWNGKVGQCEKLRLRIGNEELIVDKDKLVSLLMLLGTESEQKKLTPMKLTRVRKLERMLTFAFKATKDYKKGEPITVKAPWIDEVPDVEEVFAGNVKDRKKSPLKFFVDKGLPEA